MSERFLILEDDDRLRGTLGRALRGRGHAVEEVADLASLAVAIGVADGDPNEEAPGFDCAVVDLRLEDGSGLEAVERLLARWPALRIVVLTGYGSIATAVEAMRLGVVDYLTKPADADQILDALSAGAADGTASEERSPPRVESPSLERVEWEHIQRVLQDCGGNITRAADQLGLHRRTLQRKLAYRPPPR
jgi:two-component system response regulator RegA